MIDLETIAETRAKELDQSEKDWVETLKQPAFNDFSTYLSDGEIEEFVLSFESPVALLMVSGAFLKGFLEGNDSAYYDFTRTVAVSSLSLDQGLDFIYQLCSRENASGQSWLYLQKLEAFKNFLSDNASYSHGQDITPWLPD